MADAGAADAFAVDAFAVDAFAVDAFAVDAFAVDAFAFGAFAADGIGADCLAEARLAAGAAAGAGLNGAGLTADVTRTAFASAKRPTREGLPDAAAGADRPTVAPGGFVERAATGGFALPAPLALAMITLPLKRPSGAAEMLVRLGSFCTAHAFCQTNILRRIGALSRPMCGAWRN